MPISDSRSQRVPDQGAEESLTDRYHRVRAASVWLCEPLEVEDYGVQPMLDASPPKWHLAHTTWFFETFLLVPRLSGYRAYHPHFEHLFNSYYNGVGTPFPRQRRGTLSRPTVAEVYAYRDHVDEHMLRLLAEQDEEVLSRTVLGLNHEQQHQELLLTDIKYNLGSNPLQPAYRRPPSALSSAPVRQPDPAVAQPPAFVEFGGGLMEVGADGETFCFDNECPRHKVFLEPFALADRLVTNGEYLEFVAAGGYAQPNLWLSDGWAWLQQNPTVTGPLYWSTSADPAERFEYRLCGPEALDLDAPVTHVSFYEAQAYAQWRGARLPSEHEWEKAADGVALAGNFVEAGRLHPQPASGGGPLRQMFGDVWEWTASPYVAYPGFAPLAGALGEYNGKFMSSQWVLRGGSCASPREHIRGSYRNFFYPPDRWQFSGIRLAKSI